MGRLTAADLEGLGLSAERLKAYLHEIERVRAQMSAARAGNPEAPPTFADLLLAMEKNHRMGKGGTDGGASGPNSTKGQGELRGVTEGLKENIDLEYQDLLDEYYRSLADPAWKRAKK